VVAMVLEGESEVVAEVVAVAARHHHLHRHDPHPHHTVGCWW